MISKKIHNYFEENLIKPKDNSHSSELDFDEKKKSKGNIAYYNLN